MFDQLVLTHVSPPSGLFSLVSLNFLRNYILEIRQAAGWEGETGCMEASESDF